MMLSSAEVGCLIAHLFCVCVCVCLGGCVYMCVCVCVFQRTIETKHSVNSSNSIVTAQKQFKQYVIPEVPNSDCDRRVAPPQQAAPMQTVLPPQITPPMFPSIHASNNNISPRVLPKKPAAPSTSFASAPPLNFGSKGNISMQSTCVTDDYPSSRTDDIDDLRFLNEKLKKKIKVLAVCC